MLLLLYTAQLSLAQAASVSSNFRVVSHPTALAAGKSRSVSFGLDSCIDNVLAGSSSSSNFKLQSGCGASFGEPYVAVGVPADSPWALWLLTLAVVLTAAFYLRPGGSNAS